MIVRRTGDACTSVTHLRRIDQGETFKITDELSATFKDAVLMRIWTDANHTGRIRAVNLKSGSTYMFNPSKKVSRVDAHVIRED